MKNAVSHACFSHHSSVPDAPDVWVWINGDNTGQLVWKVFFFFIISCTCLCAVFTWILLSHTRYLSLSWLSHLSLHAHSLTPLLSSSLFQPMTHRQSHGQIRAYKVTFWSPEENEQHSEVILPSSFAAPVNLSHFAAFSGDRIVASVIAENMGGASPPSSVLIPLNWTGTS